MDTAPESRHRASRIRVSRIRASTIMAAVAVITLAACGAPVRARTLDREPDLVRVDQGAIPHGFSPSAKEELQRLRSACAAIDANVATLLPDVAPPRGSAASALAFVDAQCEWRGVTSAPELIVGLLAHPGGGTVLDQTTTVITGDRSVSDTGDRAVFDPQTRTLYVVTHDRLWYLQLVGAAPAVSVGTVLTALARSLVHTPAATR
jgi:hypothetical protein